MRLKVMTVYISPVLIKTEKSDSISTNVPHVPTLRPTTKRLDNFFYNSKPFPVRRRRRKLLWYDFDEFF